jgi:hypothetical protein
MFVTGTADIPWSYFYYNVEEIEWLIVIILTYFTDVIQVTGNSLDRTLKHLNTDLIY